MAVIIVGLFVVLPKLIIPAIYFGLFKYIGKIELSMFENNSFDLVLNIEGPFSFCGADAEKKVLLI